MTDTNNKTYENILIDLEKKMVFSFGKKKEKSFFLGEKKEKSFTHNIYTLLIHLFIKLYCASGHV